MVTTTSFVGAPVIITRFRRIPARSNCFSSTSNSDLLRSQLDQLHTEAESARAKANSNRLRLLRLSEAAENLRKQAAINVQTGKENVARELLLQKKKVMQALDKAKSRIELLDTLSSKLNEAISLKETQLIGNIYLDVEVDKENNNNTSSEVHIVSPKPENEKNVEEYQETIETDVLSGKVYGEVSTYESFLESLDKKLGEIEGELVTVINVASLVLNYEDKPKNLKVQQTVEILDEIRRVRERIASIIYKEANIS